MEIPEDVQSDWKALSIIVLGATGDLVRPLSSGDTFN